MYVNTNGKLNLNFNFYSTVNLKKNIGTQIFLLIFKKQLNKSQNLKG